jgi:hypothetical protein
MQRLVVPRIAQERLDPRLVGVVRRPVLLEQQLAEQDADADVGERPEGEDAVRRRHEPVDLGILGLYLRDDVADGLVDERQPDLLRARHLSTG